MSEEKMVTRYSIDENGAPKEDESGSFVKYSDAKKIVDAYESLQYTGAIEVVKGGAYVIVAQWGYCKSIGEWFKKKGADVLIIAK